MINSPFIFQNRHLFLTFTILLRHLKWPFERAVEKFQRSKLYIWTYDGLALLLIYGYSLSYKTTVLTGHQFCVRIQKTVTFTPNSDVEDQYTSVIYLLFIIYGISSHNGKPNNSPLFLIKY